MTDENLIHDGICPVCGDEFTDGFEQLSEGHSVEGVRLCVIEKDGDGGIGECLLHLPDDQKQFSPDYDQIDLTEQ